MKARDEIIARIITREGGVADVGDGKGVTRWGQTPQWLKTFDLPTPTNATEAADNYAEWMRVTRLDQLIGPTPDVLADVVLDYAVHAGHVPAIKALQVAVQVQADGIIGPVTLESIGNDFDRDRAAGFVIAQRGEFLGGLIADKPQKHAKFARGWMRRQGEFIRALVS